MSADASVAVLERVNICAALQRLGFPGSACVGAFDQAEVGRLLAIGGIWVASSEKFAGSGDAAAHRVLG